MKYKIDGVNVRTIEDEVLVAGAVKLYKAVFEFDETWDDYTSIFAVFKTEHEEREVLLEDKECEIPWEVLDKGGTLLVGMYGTTEERIRPTLWAVPKTIKKGAERCEASLEPTPDVWQQFLAELRRIAGADPEVIGRYVLEYLAENPPADGDDGFSPIVETKAVEGGHNVTITDASGAHEFFVANGEPGTPGTPGKTPVKGVDYHTEADKAEMVTAVLAALPNGDEVSY